MIMSGFKSPSEPYNWPVTIALIVLAGVVVFFLGLGVLASAPAIGGVMLGFYMLQTGLQEKQKNQGSNWAYIIGGVLLMACQLIGFVGFIFINFSGLGTMIGFFGAVLLMGVSCVIVHNHVASAHGGTEAKRPTLKGLMGATCLVSQLWFFGSVIGFITSGPLFFVVPFVISYTVVMAASVWFVGQALSHSGIDCFGCGGDGGDDFGSGSSSRCQVDSAGQVQSGFLKTTAKAVTTLASPVEGGEDRLFPGEGEEPLCGNS